jgi:branched-chain amino acid transport system ATP-binding protein
MLKIAHVCLSYGRFQALDDVSMEMATQGRLHGIIGPNGAGKSTLMDAIAGRRRLTAGQVFYRGQDITARSIAWRRRHGMARSFQKSSLFPSLGVGEQLQLVARNLGERQLDDIIAAMDLGDYLGIKAGQIAYGVQRRIDVALALIGRPQLLLLDEPGAGLSAAETLALFRHLKLLVRDRNIAAVVVEHDIDAVFSTCDTISVMDLGRHVVTGAPADVRGDQRVITAYLGSAG